MINLQMLPNRKPDEKTVLFLRRHWIVPARILCTLALGFVIPPALYLLMKQFNPAILASPMISALIALAACFYVLAVWMFVFQDVITYYLDMWIVTTERIISIEQIGLFHRTSSELHLTDVVDVTSSIDGVLRTLLNFGEVVIETPGEQEHFHFFQVPHPESVRETILKCVDDARARRGVGSAVTEMSNSVAPTPPTSGT